MHQTHPTIILHSSFTPESSGFDKIKKKKGLFISDADIILALLGHELGRSRLHLSSRVLRAGAPPGQIKHVLVSSPAISEHLEVVR